MGIMRMSSLSPEEDLTFIIYLYGAYSFTHFTCTAAVPTRHSSGCARGAAGLDGLNP